MASSPLKKSLLEATIFLQTFVVAVKSGLGIYFFAQYMYIGFSWFTLIIITLVDFLWIVLLFLTFTQIRLKASATARQTLVIETLKSGIITGLAVWGIVQYVLNVHRLGDHSPWGRLSTFHVAWECIVVGGFCFGLFYPTLILAWLDTRTVVGAIRLNDGDGEETPILPQ